jgi:hypothetical protein
MDKHHAMKTYGGVEMKIQAPSTLTPANVPGIHWISGWVGLST